VAINRPSPEHDVTVTFGMPESILADLDWLCQQRGEARSRVLCDAVELLLEYRRLADQQALAARTKHSRRKMVGAD